MVIKKNTIKICPKCKGKDLSSGENDFIYSFEEDREIPIQYCNDCHEEWKLE